MGRLVRVEGDREPIQGIARARGKVGRALRDEAAQTGKEHRIVRGQSVHGRGQGPERLGGVRLPEGRRRFQRGQRFARLSEGHGLGDGRVRAIEGSVRPDEPRLAEQEVAGVGVEGVRVVNLHPAPSEARGDQPASLGHPFLDGGDLGRRPVAAVRNDDAHPVQAVRQILPGKVDGMQAARAQVIRGAGIAKDRDLANRPRRRHPANRVEEESARVVLRQALPSKERTMPVGDDATRSHARRSRHGEPHAVPGLAERDRKCRRAVGAQWARRASSVDGLNAGRQLGEVAGSVGHAQPGDQKEGERRNEFHIRREVTSNGPREAGGRAFRASS